MLIENTNLQPYGRAVMCLYGSRRERERALAKDASIGARLPPLAAFVFGDIL